MRRLFWVALALFASCGVVSAQSLDDLNIQIHGYATQGFLYTTQNNLMTTPSTDGSPGWTEAVVNVTSQPDPKLRIGVQGRYFLLGNLGNAITLDWAQADYRVSDKLGVRFGKVKSPLGLWNEVQDIDPSYQWVLLPQSVYPLMSRNSLLAHYGGVVYGTVKTPSAGKVEYRLFGGERTLASDDGYFLTQKQAGSVLPNGISGSLYGGQLRWHTPLRGLMLGASDSTQLRWTAKVTVSAYNATGNEIIAPLSSYYYFGKYENEKLMVAAEWDRLPGQITLALKGLPASQSKFDLRGWYAMATYKTTNKLTLGMYQSQYFSMRSALGPARYEKDWTLNGRYDFNSFIYAKVEQHFVDGRAVGYDTDMNANGLMPDSRWTAMKIGVSF